MAIPLPLYKVLMYLSYISSLKPAFKRIYLFHPLLEPYVDLTCVVQSFYKDGPKSLSVPSITAWYLVLPLVLYFSKSNVFAAGFPVCILYADEKHQKTWSHDTCWISFCIYLQIGTFLFDM